MFLRPLHVRSRKIIMISSFNIFLKQPWINYLIKFLVYHSLRRKNKSRTTYWTIFFNSFPLKIICRHKLSKLFKRRKKLHSIFAFKWVLQPIYICHKLGQMLSLHYVLKMFETLVWMAFLDKTANALFWRRRQHSYAGKPRATATGNVQANIFNLHQPS